jgi:hypothetical protein
LEVSDAFGGGVEGDVVDILFGARTGDEPGTVGLALGDGVVLGSEFGAGRGEPVGVEFGREEMDESALRAAIWAS